MSSTSSSNSGPEIHDLELPIHSMNEKAKKLSEDNTQLEKKIEEFSITILEKSEDNNNLRNKLNTTTKKVQLLESIVQQQEKKIEELHENLNEYQRRLDVLIDCLEDLARENQSLVKKTTETPPPLYYRDDCYPIYKIKPNETAKRKDSLPNSINVRKDILSRNKLIHPTNNKLLRNASEPPSQNSLCEEFDHIDSQRSPKIFSKSKSETIYDHNSSKFDEFNDFYLIHTESDHQNPSKERTFHNDLEHTEWPKGPNSLIFTLKRYKASTTELKEELFKLKEKCKSQQLSISKYEQAFVNNEKSFSQILEMERKRRLDAEYLVDFLKQQITKLKSLLNKNNLEDESHIGTAEKNAS